MKYDEVTNQVLQHSRDNDDVVLECLNLFALFLNSGEYQPYNELPEVKEKLNFAFQEHENLLSKVRHNMKVENIYNELKDRNKDNIQI